MKHFRDRRQAGRLLAPLLEAYAHRPDTLVLGLARGGVPVAHEVAKALHLPLDVFVVRKLGVPGYEELAMGAIATGGVQIVNPTVIHALHIPRTTVEDVAAHERVTLELRERIYRGGGPAPDVRRKGVILVDDGLAMGATLRSAIGALRQQDAAWIVVAIPVATADAIRALQLLVDAVVAVDTPETLDGIGICYDDFGGTSDVDVSLLLDDAREDVLHDEPHRR